MIIKRKPRILFIDGYGSEEKGQHTIYDGLCKYLDDAKVDNAHIPSSSVVGLEKFKGIDLSKYSLVVGFSMGGLYAGTVSSIPRVLINPGYGGSSIFPELGPLETLNKENKDTYLFFSDQDKYRTVLKPETMKRFKRVHEIYKLPGKHVPTEEELRDYVVPVIKEILEL